MEKLTKLQQEMLLHRVHVPCAILEVFESEEHLEHFDKNDIEKAIVKFEAIVESGVLCNKSQDINKLMKAVICDVMDGNTFFGNVDEEETAQKAHAINRSADNLEFKVFYEYDIVAKIPRY